jgi:copper homeostasis protein
MIELVRKKISIGLHVLIRPRRGGFHYTPSELEVMFRDIACAKSAGANGVVIGVLTKNSTFDLPALRELIEAALPMRVTIHRAFDVCKNPFGALGELIDAGADAVLSSGQARSAVEGLSLLTELRSLAVGKIEIMAAGKLTVRNVDVIRRTSGLTSFHVGSGVCVRQRDGRPDGFFSSGELEVVDSVKVAAIIEALGSIGGMETR